MKFKIPNSKKEIWVNIDKYRIDWDKATRSKFQSSVKKFLRPYLEKHVVVEEFRIPKTRLSVDILDFTTRTAFEIQGKQHQEPVRFFQRNISGFLAQQGRDAYKWEFLEFNGYIFIQILPEDLAKLSPEFFKTKFNIIL